MEMIIEYLMMFIGLIFGSLFLSMFSYMITKCICDAKNSSKLNFLKHLKDMEEINNGNKE